MRGCWDPVRKRFTYMFQGKTYRVAKLICQAFHVEQPFAEAVVMHLDENSKNNRPTNLRWGTQKENLNAPGFIDYCHGRVGEKSPVKKHQTKAS